MTSLINIATSLLPIGHIPILIGEIFALKTYHEDSQINKFLRYFQKESFIRFKFLARYAAKHYRNCSKISPNISLVGALQEITHTRKLVNCN